MRQQRSSQAGESSRKQWLSILTMALPPPSPLPPPGSSLARAAASPEAPCTAGAGASASGRPEGGVFSPGAQEGATDGTGSWDASLAGCAANDDGAAFEGPPEGRVFSPGRQTGAPGGTGSASVRRVGTEAGQPATAAAAAAAGPPERLSSLPGSQRGAPGDSGWAGAHSMGTGSEPGPGADVAAGGGGDWPLGRLFMTLRRCRLQMFDREKPLVGCAELRQIAANSQGHEEQIWSNMSCCGHASELLENKTALGPAAKVLAPIPSMPRQMCAGHIKVGSSLMLHASRSRHLWMQIPKLNCVRRSAT